MATTTNWTRREVLAALDLYLRLPFGQLHQRNPEIIRLAEWLGRTPGAVALKLVNIASLDPQVRENGLAGMANASALDRSIWTELQTNWDTVAEEAAREYDQLGAQNGVKPTPDDLDELSEVGLGRTRSALVQVRVNQERFRRAILASYDATCCISGLRHDKLVIASHIVPWSMDTTNRLNPQNGLCLSALHDRAYDQGLLTVLPDYTIRVADALREKNAGDFMASALLAYDKQSIRLPSKLRPSPGFLEMHARRFGYLP